MFSLESTLREYTSFVFFSSWSTYLHGTFKLALHKSFCLQTCIPSWDFFFFLYILHLWQRRKNPVCFGNGVFFRRGVFWGSAPETTSPRRQAIGGSTTGKTLQSSPLPPHLWQPDLHRLVAEKVGTKGTRWEVGGGTRSKGRSRGRHNKEREHKRRSIGQPFPFSKQPHCTSDTTTPTSKCASREHTHLPTHTSLQTSLVRVRGGKKTSQSASKHAEINMSGGFATKTQIVNEPNDSFLLSCALNIHCKYLC